MESASLLTDLDPLEVVFVAVVAFLGSVSAGLSGLGGGLLLAVAVSPIVGIEALVPMIAVAMLINHVARVWVFRAEVNWPLARRVISTALPMTIVGATVYAALSPRVVAIVIGLFVLVFVPARRIIGEAAWRLSTPGMLGVGGIFGFVSGATVGAGMIIVPVLLGTGLTGAALVGTDAVIGLTVLIAKTVTFSSLSVLTEQYVVFGLVTGLFTVPGVYVARWIIHHTSVRVHTLLIELLLVGGGVSFVYRGVFGE